MNRGVVIFNPEIKQFLLEHLPDDKFTEIKQRLAASENLANASHLQLSREEAEAILDEIGPANMAVYKVIRDFLDNIN